MPRVMCHLNIAVTAPAGLQVTGGTLVVSQNCASHPQSSISGGKEQAGPELLSSVVSCEFIQNSIPIFYYTPLLVTVSFSRQILISPYLQTTFKVL